MNAQAFQTISQELSLIPNILNVAGQLATIHKTLTAFNNAINTNVTALNNAINATA